MYEKKRIAVVVPAFNEEKLIGRVIETMPDYVDSIIVVDDVSNDETAGEVKKYFGQRDGIVLLEHEKNQGVGGAIATGYKYARDHGFDVAVVMAGDAQMDPSDLSVILEPVVTCEVDYSKGNRLFSGEAYRKIPRMRYFGNAVLSLLTKIASGYWHVADSQTGYTAINSRALRIIDWDTMYKRYGQPNDLLVMLNVYNFKVRDVPINSVYNIGEKSGIRIGRVIFTIGALLLKRFLWRLKEKYIIRDFHPLVFFYLLGFLFGLGSALLFIRLIVYWILNGVIPGINALAAMFAFMSSALFTLFAMWFDMESNKDLR